MDFLLICINIFLSLEETFFLVKSLIKSLFTLTSYLTEKQSQPDEKMKSYYEKSRPRQISL